MEKALSQNQRNLRRLLMSVQASYGRLNLLIAICDNWKYRDELISSYEKELASKGISCHRVKIDRQQPSLKQCLQDLGSQEPALMSVEKPAIVTVLGADELLGIRLNEPKSAQEQFFFSVQWTREGLREFKFPIVIWLTPKIATSLAQQAPDFWSWRGGVFEFSQSISASIEFLSATHELNSQVESTQEDVIKVDPSDLQKQIDELLSQTPDSPLLASLYNSLGKAYKDAVRYAEAEEPYQKALELYEHQLGKEHSDVAFTLNELAGLYESQGKYSEAEPLCLRSLEILERQLGADHPDVATSLNNLAGLYRAQGKYSEAEPLYRRSLEIYERQLGADHPQVATSLNNLASLYESQGKYSEAEPMYLRSLEIRERQLGADHPDVATSFNNLAALCYSQGRYEEAEPLYHKALAILMATVGKKHLHTQSVMVKLMMLKLQNTTGIDTATLQQMMQNDPNAIMAMLQQMIGNTES
jgi:tetratricopeptide (TPR) repeat protein